MNVADRVIRWSTALAVVGVAAVAAVVSYELLMAIIRSVQAPAVARPAFDVQVTDPLRERAAVVFAADLAAARVPSALSVRSSTSASSGCSSCGTTLPQELQGGPEVPLREQLAGGVKPTPRLKGYCNAQATAGYGRLPHAWHPSVKACRTFRSGPP